MASGAEEGRDKLRKDVYKRQVALVVTIVLVLALKTPTVNFLAGSALANNISTKIAEER